MRSVVCEMRVVPDGELLRFEPAVAIVGFSGRDEGEVEAHLVELEHLGIARPESVPVIWWLSAGSLESGSTIGADPARSSGEVEPVLVRVDGSWYLAVGSDHTDREVQRTSLEAAKAACPKVIADECWSVSAFAQRWDQLELTSEVRVDGRWATYQRGSLGTLRELDFYLDRFGGVEGDLVVFCGTVPAVDGMVLGADRFRGTLHDVALGRALTVDYAYSGC